MVLSEAIAVDYDFERGLDSNLDGHEFALSYSHRSLAKEAGLNVVFERDRPSEVCEEHYPIRWFQLVATHPQPR